MGKKTVTGTMMTKKLRYLLIAFGSLMALQISCASKPCREPLPPEGATPIERPSEVREAAAETAKTSGKETFPDRVWVAKPDGSKQCEAKGTTPEQMKKQLKGIQIFDQKSE